MAELLARATLATARVTSSSSTAADSEEMMLALKAASISTVSTVCDLLGLPPEILVEIFGYLLHTDLCRLQQVNGRLSFVHNIPFLDY
jgi:ABC-type arginine/histidine transport system permease subunit